MKYSRSMAALAAALLILGGLAACGGEKESAEGTDAESTAIAATPDSAELAEQAALAAEAKVAEADARATALKEVPGATVTTFELEKENGKLIYSYDLKVAGEEGIEEVQIDGVTGAIVSHVHESPADEAKEAAAEGKEGAEADEAAPAKEESQAALMKEAKVTEAAALATALKEVPGGKVQVQELEREDGKLIYSIILKVAGKDGVEEINVDAITGKVVNREHEADPAPAPAAKKGGD